MSLWIVAYCTEALPDLIVEVEAWDPKTFAEVR